MGQLIDISKNHSFQEPFAQFGGLGFFQFGKLLQVLNNQLCQDFSVSFFFENVNKGQLRMVNVNYQKWSDLTILSF